MNWLITGGCGFIGTNLVARLTRAGSHDHIRVLDNLSVGTRADLSAVAPVNDIQPAAIAAAPTGLERVVGDILDENLELALVVNRRIGARGEELPEQAAAVLVAAALPGPRTPAERRHESSGPTSSVS